MRHWIRNLLRMEMFWMPETGRYVGYGFVSFSSKVDVEATLMTPFIPLVLMPIFFQNIIKRCEARTWNWASSFFGNLGNLAKTITTKTLKRNLLRREMLWMPEIGRSSGYGFVSFSLEANVEEVIYAFNNVVQLLTPFWICRIKFKERNLKCYFMHRNLFLFELEYVLLIL